MAGLGHGQTVSASVELRSVLEIRELDSLFQMLSTNEVKQERSVKQEQLSVLMNTFANAVGDLQASLRPRPDYWSGIIRDLTELVPSIEVPEDVCNNGSPVAAPSDSPYFADYLEDTPRGEKRPYESTPTVSSGSGSPRSLPDLVMATPSSLGFRHPIFETINSVFILACFDVKTCKTWNPVTNMVDMDPLRNPADLSFISGYETSKSKRDCMSLPGGKVDPLMDSDFIDTGVRECLEETGLVLDRLRAALIPFSINKMHKNVLHIIHFVGYMFNVPESSVLVSVAPSGPNPLYDIRFRPIQVIQQDPRPTWVVSVLEFAAAVWMDDLDVADGNSPGHYSFE